jgi:transcriptional regulator with XRE-family HTH domain
MMSRGNKQILRLPYNQVTMGELGKLAAQRIREAREAAELTQAELGDALNISGNAVTKIENGRSTLTLQNLEQLPKILNRPIEYFLGLDTGMTADEEQLLAAYRRLPKTGPARASALAVVQALVDAIFLHSEDDTPGLG